MTRMTSPRSVSMRVSASRGARRAGLALVFGAATLAAAGSVVATPEAGAGHVVLVELFTSQGCSSCPPADRLLSAIAGEDGSRVVPLAFHVDFWNSQGWTDPFSSREWTLRQVAYEKRLGLDQVYTPQAVVDGATQMVGSDAAQLRAAIQTAAAQPGAKLAISTKPSGSKVEVGVDVDLPETVRSQKLDVWVVVFETGLSTPVGRGENGGKTLQNDYVVRVLDRAGRTSKDGPAQSHYATSLRLAKEWNASRLGVAAFLQDPGSLAVRGSAARPLAAPGS